MNLQLRSYCNTEAQNTSLGKASKIINKFPYLADPPPLVREFIVDFYLCFLQYEKELKGELKGFESQILI